jgi:hypothetical protein
MNVGKTQSNMEEAMCAMLCQDKKASLQIPIHIAPRPEDFVCAFGETTYIPVCVYAC